MMSPLTQVQVFAGSIILLLLLTAIAVFAYSQIRALSLPIPQALAFFTVVLPIFTGISTYSAYRLLRYHTANLTRLRPTLYLILLLSFQLIYETVIATLSLTYVVPTSSLSCGLNEQWKRLRSSKDDVAIRRIQDRFDCCGFNSIVDRAWPFPSGRPGDGIGPGECAERFGRSRPCAQSWRQAEQLNAGLFFTVAAAIFMVKLMTIVAVFSTRPFKRGTAGENGAERRLIDEGEPHQEYQDDVEAGTLAGPEAYIENANVNGSRPRIEPSALQSAGGEWRD